MNLSIRQWLAERYIEIHQLKELSVGQMAGLAFRITEHMEANSLVPFHICTLTEVLELPLGAVWQEITVIALLTENLLRSISQKKPLKRNEGTWLAFQIAYLQALQQVLEQEALLQKPWLDRAMIWLKSTKGYIEAAPHTVPLHPLKDTQLHGLLKTLKPGKLSDTQAEQALSLVADSLLVQQMNNVTIAWLVTNGTEEFEAKLLTQRLGHALGGHLLRVIADNAVPLAQLQKFVCLGNLLPPISPTPETEMPGISSLTMVDDKIDLYGEQYRASLLQSLSTPLFMESFALKDIYVPLTGFPIEESSGEPLNKTISPVDLRIWAQQQLNDLETIAIIESEPGYGKTSFCQIWAAKVARELYPTWLPIVIRLREITYGNSLESTLNSGFSLRHQTNLATWLEQNHPRCLLLLDGWDELPPCRQGKRAKVIFLQGLLRLQSQGRHKIFLTTRSLNDQEIIPELLLVSKRIAIAPFDVEALRQWFQQWATVQALPIAQNYFTFLKQAGLFANNSKLPELSAFVRQPLMLYLLGILHRDGLLDEKVLQLAAQSQQTTSATLSWEIYQRLSRWLLGYPLTGGIKTILLRSGSAHIHRTPVAIANLLSTQHPQELLEQIQAKALKILHSDRYQVNLAEQLPSNTLPAFYFRHFLTQQPQATSKIEFTHSTLGEYLCAEAIVTQLNILTKSIEAPDGTVSFVLDSPSSVAQHLYNLLGYGILSLRIEELAIAGLQRLQKWEFSFVILSQRLECFWRAYCQGRWMDEGIAHKALVNFHALQNPVNVEQVNAAVGLNVFLLLCACYRQQKIPFSPCGNAANSLEFNPQALHLLIARTAVLSNSAFVTRIKSQSLAGINLSAAYLLQVMLAKANLQQTNLSDAVLIGANLAGANLTGANLAGANLKDANLVGANLTDANLTVANLSGANLAGANLTGTNLTHTCVFDTIMNDADKETATLSGAIFSLEQFHSLKQLLSKHSLRNITKSSDNAEPDLKNLGDAVLIESLEGEVILPVDLYPDDADDETIVSVGVNDNSHND